MATGYVLRSDALARLGAALVLVGAAALLAYAAQVWPARARWTTDAGWHRFATGALLSSMAWFEVGIVVAAVRVLVGGADPAAGGSDALVGPLVVGWVGFAVLGSATHLVPAVGPGDPATHAAQRRLLGRLATTRLAISDAGIAALSAGLALRMDAVALAGAVGVALAWASSAILVLAAVMQGRRTPADPPRPGPSAG